MTPQSPHIPHILHDHIPFSQNMQIFQHMAEDVLKGCEEEGAKLERSRWIRGKVSSGCLLSLVSFVFGFSLLFGHGFSGLFVASRLFFLTPTLVQNRILWRYFIFYFAGAKFEKLGWRKGGKRDKEVDYENVSDPVAGGDNVVKVWIMMILIKYYSEVWMDLTDDLLHMMSNCTFFVGDGSNRVANLDRRVLWGLKILLTLWQLSDLILIRREKRTPRFRSTPAQWTLEAIAKYVVQQCKCGLSIWSLYICSTMWIGFILITGMEDFYLLWFLYIFIIFSAVLLFGIRNIITLKESSLEDIIMLGWWRGGRLHVSELMCNNDVYKNHDFLILLALLRFMFL